ncbi:SAV_2336 N-terminal domain-related protein [Streptomyces iconiensis]|uniref:SAV_2336 N-terminal domain-related protein n=1 Tax=Streptomyces iconiensis TaxID=1384038 RepID=A0ABT7A2G7_9ACTN|nr:SAV_2336 N-terminal domain-related protein [Streptomyces iconiensis]MDJ1135264.1 SAV_2336 N-terminal domain-related protein [Streptomyces iconiensis]
MSEPRQEPRAAPSADQLAGGLAELVARLRAAGWDPSSEEVAEAVWLARWTGQRSQDVSDEDSTRLRYSGTRTRHAEPPMPSPPERPSPVEAPPVGPERTAPVSLYAPLRHGGAMAGGFPVRAPAAGALSGLLELQHALRPLHRYRPPLPPTAGGLDEEATADLSARSTAVRPVFGTEPRRATEIQLLMDASATASVWQPTLERLRQTFEQLGAFGDVQVRYLHRARDGVPLIGTGPAEGTTRLRPADQYRDTTGRRLTLVVSDCVGPLWQDGRAQRLLHHWTGRAPLAVVQPLPPRLWPRTALPAEPGLLVRERGAGGRVTFESDGYAPQPSPEAVPVPVLLPTPEALGNWARLLGGYGDRTVPGAAAWVLPRHPAMPPPVSAPGTVPPRTLLREFRNTASPGAVDLAVHLAVVPLLLPVIHLVQESMLPDTGPLELAEVLLSGLLERLPDRDGAEGPRYAFAPGVTELLLQSLDKGAAVLILKHLSDYVAQRFGKGTRNFPAFAVAQLTGRPGSPPQPPPGREPGDGGASGRGYGEGHTGGYEDYGAGETAEVGDELFAEIPAEVVRFYLPEHSATDQVAEAERLLALWRAQGDAQLLHQARSVAEAARAAEGDSERSRLVLAQVLHALAGTRTARLTSMGEESLLRDAATLLTGEEPGTLLERAAVEHDLWRIQGATAHLLHAERLLRSLADTSGQAPPLRANAERTRKLRLGRVLLALARAAPEHRRRAASEAVRELREASEMLADRASETSDPSAGPATAEPPASGRPTGGRAGAGGDDAAGDDAAGQRCTALLDLAAALSLTGAGPGERLRVLERAREAAGERRDLNLRCARERARVLRESSAWDEAAEAYAQAERLTVRDSAQRGELLTEWGEMLLTEANDIPRAEGILREALTRAPVGSRVISRAALLLGKVLLLRYEREGFRPDLYEGCHLLEQAARQDPEAERRATAWLALGRARALFPEDAPQFQQAGADLTNALEEAEEGGKPSGSVTVARALHARGDFHRRASRRDEALADYRAAAAEWQRLANHLAEVPWSEVRETRARVTELAPQ